MFLIVPKVPFVSVPSIDPKVSICFIDSVGTNAILKNILYNCSMFLAILLLNLHLNHYSILLQNLDL